MRAFVFTIGAAAACGSIPSDLAPGKDVHRTIQIADSNPLLGSLEREYMIRLPSGYTGKNNAGVFFSFHGWGDDFEWSGNLPAMCDDMNMILVRPNGMSDGQEEMRSWNVGQAGLTDICSADTPEYEYTSCIVSKNTSHCNCGTCYDDVKFVGDLMAQLTSELCIDGEDIHAMGFSFGAMFNYFLAPELIRRQYPFRLASISPFYGAFYKGMTEIPDMPTSVFHYHGDRDTTVPVDGSDSYDGYHWDSVEFTLDAYASANGCSATSEAIATPWDSVHPPEGFRGCTEYTSCTEGRIVRCDFNEDHGFWPSYGEDMIASFLKSIRSQAQALV